MSGLSARAAAALLTVGVLLGIIVGFVVCMLAGQRTWMPGVQAQILVLFAATLLLGALAAAALVWMGRHESPHSWLYVALFCMVTMMIAAARADQMSFVEASLAIVFGSVALVAAVAALSLFRQGEAIELESNWGGIGGALGGWRLSSATSLILSALVFACGAMVASRISHDHHPTAQTDLKAPKSEKDGKTKKQEPKGEFTGEKVMQTAIRSTTPPAISSQLQLDIAPAATSRLVP